MMKRIKEYLEYRKKMRAVKKTYVKIMSAVLPALENIIKSGANAVNFIINLANEAKAAESQELIAMTMNKIAEILKTEDNRLTDVLSYMVNLQSDEIQKILAHSIIETNDEIKSRVE